MDYYNNSQGKMEIDSLGRLLIYSKAVVSCAECATTVKIGADSLRDYAPPLYVFQRQLKREGWHKLRRGWVCCQCFTKHHHSRVFRGRVYRRDKTDPDQKDNDLV